VFAEDINNAISEITNVTISVDIHIIDDDIKGYLIDLDSNDIWDVFYNDTTENQTDTEKQNDSYYLIDSDGDGKWDYAFKQETELLTYLDYLIQKYFIIFQTEMSTPGFEIITVLSIIALLAIILRRRKFNK
jgi:hypothetical protein